MTRTTPAPPTRFMVLVYRMPAKPTAGRVAVWRQLKKMGAIYLQQSVCVFPDSAGVRRELNPIVKRVDAAGGEYHLLPMRTLPAEEQQKLITQFLEQTAKHYAEIIENCEVNFTKEIEFETFRLNFTYEEAEEIRSEFEKICTWFERVRNRDWFGAPHRADAEGWLRRCEQMLEEFEAKVYEVQTAEGNEGAFPPLGRRRRRNGSEDVSGITMKQIVHKSEASR